ncbi:MAG TPA: hypothetical protein EYP43_00850 [Thermoplasmata archaeon]|nr:hypothetical protein [Thermoplasmata archaeon]
MISLSSTALALQLETEFDFTEFLPENSEITDDILYMTDNFDFGTEKANILVKGDISDPAVLLAMAETERNIRDDPYVNEGDSIESILTLMRDVANGTYGPDPTFTAMYEASNLDGDGVPDANITALFGYLMGNETYMFQTVRVLHYDEESGRFDGAVIRVGVNSHNGAKAKAISEDMERNIRPLEREPGVTNVVATSGPILMHYIVNSIETSGLQSLLITVVVAGVILTIVFYFTERSIVLGVLTEIPVILVIAWVFASMYISGMNLNVMTIMIASLTVGLGITYGIHVTHRFVEELRRLGDIDEACRSTVVNTGTALFGAAVTTIGGFSILIFAPIPPIRTFGSISALAIFFSLIASVFVLPTFLSLWSKYVQRRDPDRFRRPVHPGRAVRARPAGRHTQEHRAPATRSKDRSRTTGFGRGGPVHPPASAHGVGKRGAAPPGTTSRPDDVDDDGATDDVDRHDGGTAGVSARVDETRETDDISDYAGDDGPDEVTGAGPGRVGDETSDDGGVDGPDDGADDRRAGDVSDDHEMSDGTEYAGPGERGMPARPGSTDEEFRAE